MKKNLYAIIALSACILSQQSAYSTTVTFGVAPTARTVKDSSAVTLVSGSTLIMVGTFASTAFTFNPSLSIQDNFNAISTAGTWSQFGATDPTPLTLSVSPAGKVSGGVTDNTASANAFNADPMYLWVFNATTVAAATEMGIFRSTDAIVPWTFANNAGGVGDDTTFSTTATGAPTMLAFGGAGSTTSTTMTLVSAVPEPSHALLLGLGAGGLLFRRRRK